MTLPRSQENDVDDHGNCKACGGVHYGTGPICVDKPPVSEAAEKLVQTLKNLREPPRSVEEWADDFEAWFCHAVDTGSLQSTPMKQKLSGILRAYAAEQVVQARAEEREACAKIADSGDESDSGWAAPTDTGRIWRSSVARAIAATIRRRGEG